MRFAEPAPLHRSLFIVPFLPTSGPHIIMFRSIASVGRSALRTGAFSRQTMIATEQPAFFNALRAFSDDAAGRSKGVVKWFDPKKGFGFIVPDDGSPDCFAHYSAVHSDGFKSLGDGEEVEFDIVEEEGGRRRAESISGPGGVPVQGSARRWSSYNDDNSQGGGGYGGGNQGGDGGYGRY